jgi:hypothetical protein
MSIFQCENCGCAENTACSEQGFKMMSELFDWSYNPSLEGKLLCRACGPTHYKGGSKMKADHWGEYGVWHNRFERRYLPRGEFKTNNQGNLEHIESGLIGNEAYKQFARSEPYPMKEAV